MGICIYPPAGKGNLGKQSALGDADGVILEDDRHLITGGGGFRVLLEGALRESTCGVERGFIALCWGKCTPKCQPYVYSRCLSRQCNAVLLDDTLPNAPETEDIPPYSDTMPELDDVITTSAVGTYIESTSSTLLRSHIRPFRRADN